MERLLCRSQDTKTHLCPLVEVKKEGRQLRTAPLRHAVACTTMNTSDPSARFEPLRTRDPTNRLRSAPMYDMIGMSTLNPAQQQSKNLCVIELITHAG